MSREDPVTMPDYSGKRLLSLIFSVYSLGLGDSALCGICKMNGKHSYFNDIVDAVLHVHRDHEVLGGSQILMLGKSLSVSWAEQQTNYSNSPLSFSQTLTGCLKPAISV